MPKKILFIGEGVALAHVSRPLVLAAAAHDAGYEVVFATSDPASWVVQGVPFDVVPLQSITPARFLAAIARGSPLFDFETLCRYVADDLELIDREHPDIVVGDLRLSLAVSARLAQVPYAGVANAYWSPYSLRGVRTSPPLAWTKAVSASVADFLFRLVRPLAFAWHAIPLNRVRRKFGMPLGPYDVRHVYTDADQVLYADVPELFPVAGAPPTHRFLGPVVWSPRLPLPDWWAELPGETPIIYVTMGSSGNPALLSRVLDALAVLPIHAIVATAGAPIPSQAPSNVFISHFLPGLAAARRASLVICNGGAPTSQQALLAGVPVLGIASNIDQLLNMQAIVDVGAGIGLRGERATHSDICEAISGMLAGPGYALAAREVAAIYLRYPAAKRFCDILEELEMSGQ